MRSFWLQHERKIDMFSFRDVETACRKHFPSLRMVREKRPDQRGWHNHKTRPWFRHKLHRAVAVHQRKETVYAASEIPEKTWLVEFLLTKLNVRLQLHQ